MDKFFDRLDGCFFASVAILSVLALLIGIAIFLILYPWHFAAFLVFVLFVFALKLLNGLIW